MPTVPLPGGEKFEIMEDTGYAAPTVATDGRRVYAIFPTGDVAGFDFKGRRLWHKSLGLPDSSYGYASSLETYENRVLIQYRPGRRQGRQVPLLSPWTGSSGQVAWETKRNLPSSWTTPDGRRMWRASRS